MADLEGLKKVLRSLVVSSAATMDAASLLRDYRRMLGEPLPSAKHGFRDPVLFLRERCSDCFLFAGPQNNPILTLIVPDSIKHIDQLVQSQKTSKLVRGKRRSVPESIIRKAQPNLISSTFNQQASRIPNGRPTSTPNRTGYTVREPWTYAEPWKLEPVQRYMEHRKPEPAPQLVTKPVTMTPRPVIREHETKPIVREHGPRPIVREHEPRPIVREHETRPIVREHETRPIVREHEPRPIVREHETRPIVREHETRPIVKTPELRPIAQKLDIECSEAPSAKVETLSNGHSDHEEIDSHQRVQRFLQKRLPVYQSQRLGSKESLRDDDSGRQTSSSLSERSASALATLQSEILRLVVRRPDGVWCSDLLRLYEEEYGHELNFARFRYPSVSACACAVQGLNARRAPDGNWLLTVHEQEPSIRCEPALRLRRVTRDASLSVSKHASRSLLDADDALPGIDYDPDVFPSDCLSFLESIPPASVAGVAPGDMLPLVVGEVYSPSHLWLQRLGEEHELMQEHMDEMTEYYSKGEGVNRVLATGARRPGQYCSSVFEGDWHRSLIVQVVDSDTVKVRHVDYGTVDTVAAAALRPLKRSWASLPAQAVRARLAGLRPAAASRRWPRAAASYCLDLVRERRLVGNVVAVDHEECILEVFLIDTSTEEDVNITEQMIRAGHADARPLPALGAREGYLLPTFAALELGETPNYTEIYALLRDGIALDFVDSYRNHVAGLLPTSSDDSGEPPERADGDGALGSDDPTSELGYSPPPSPPSPPPTLAANRVPMALSLLRLAPTPEPQPQSPPTEKLLMQLDSPEPSPVPNSTPDASPSQSAELDSPVPELQERCLTPVTPAPAPAPAASPPKAASPAAPAAAPAPAPAKPCCASSCCPAASGAPHPASFYALPCCPCSQAYKPPVPVRPVPVSLPMVRHYSPGYYRPRVSPAQYYPQFKPPVSMNYYGQPLYHQTPQNFPIAQHSQNFQAQNSHQFVPNSMQSHQQFIPNPAPSPQNFKPNPSVNFVPNTAPNPQQFVPNSMQNQQRFVPNPAPQNFKPNFAQVPQNVGPSPVPNSPNLGPSSAPNTQSSTPNSQSAPPAQSVAAQPANLGASPGGAGSAGDGPSVRLSAEECEIFELLSRVDPGAAHRYMIAALRRARGGAPGAPAPSPSPAPLNPDAPEFRAPPPDMRPPPGFENFIK